MTDAIGSGGRHGLGDTARARLLERFRGQRTPQPVSTPRVNTQSKVAAAFCRFDHHPAYERLLISQTAARHLRVDNPFFRVHDAAAGATTLIGGREYINFSSYDYLGLNHHPRVNQAASEAIERYGTSASASRLVAGERPIQRELEQALADFYGAEACVTFVSGHATNVSTIASLFGPKDLVLHDSLAHNSVIEGMKLSGAHRRSFPHNDWEALENMLFSIRGGFERALIVVEGHYSMDGDTPELARFVEIKNRHGAFLMVDEAHALGVLGPTGHGIAEHCGVPSSEVDIWMGTLSKTLASCGGYIAGSRALVELLKYTAPGFVYSVGLSPLLAAAALEALRMLEQEPSRVRNLRENGLLFLNYAKDKGINTGLSQGFSIVSVSIGSSLKATRISNQMFEAGINVQPIIHPAVEEKAARLRFFISATHTQSQLHSTIDHLAHLI
jgi:8-amino-7-oxononanoate synthase